MSWHFSQALVVESSAGISTAGAAWVPWSVNGILVGFSRPDKTTAACLLSRFGRTCVRSRNVTTPRAGSSAGCGPSGISSSSQAASPARTFPPQAKARALMGSGPDSGASMPGSFARYDRPTCSWRTHQYSLDGGLIAFSETWPRWGMMRTGACWEQRTPSGVVELRAWITKESASGSARASERMPTPSCQDAMLKQVPASVHFTKSGLPKYVSAAGVKSQMHLSQLVQMTERAPTPTKSDATGGSRPADAKRGPCPGLNAFVRMATPTVQDANGRTHHNQKDGSIRLSLLGQVTERLRTPNANDAEGWSLRTPQERKAKGAQVMLSHQAGGSLNPPWVEWLMGWTELRPLEMARFRQWSASQPGS